VIHLASHMGTEQSLSSSASSSSSTSTTLPPIQYIEYRQTAVVLHSSKDGRFWIAAEESELLTNKWFVKLGTKPTHVFCFHLVSSPFALTSNGTTDPRARFGDIVSVQCVNLDMPRFLKSTKSNHLHLSQTESERLIGKDLRGENAFTIVPGYSGSGSEKKAGDFVLANDLISLEPRELSHKGQICDQSSDYVRLVESKTQNFGFALRLATPHLAPGQKPVGSENVALVADFARSYTNHPTSGLQSHEKKNRSRHN